MGGASLSTLRVCKKFYLDIVCGFKKFYLLCKKGMFDLRVWPGVEGSEKTPGKAPDKDKEQMQRLAKLAKKHRNGEIPKVLFFCTFLIISNTWVLTTLPWESNVLLVDRLERIDISTISSSE